MAFARSPWTWTPCQTTFACARTLNASAHLEGAAGCVKFPSLHLGIAVFAQAAAPVQAAVSVQVVDVAVAKVRAPLTCLMMHRGARFKVASLSGQRAGTRVEGRREVYAGDWIVEMDSLHDCLALLVALFLL